MTAKTSDPTDLERLPLPDVLTYRLVVLVNRLNRQAATILKRRAGLRLPEWRCLALLGSNGRMSVAELTATSVMDKALISRTVWDLNEKGLVITERAAHDRRLLNVSLTAAGEQMFHEILPIMRRRLGDLTAGLTERELTTVLTSIDKITAAYQDWAAHDSNDTAA